MNDTEHFPAITVQVVEENEPAPPVLAKVTVPPGVIGVPAVDESATVAAHVLGWLITTIAGAQLTMVDVALLLTVTLVVPWLELWVTSPM